MPIAPLAPLGEHLVLEREIGHGAMGTVWVAEHRALGTRVAVKVMLPARTGDPTAAERFSREARAAAQIKSPHVAQVFDCGVTPDGEPYLVMELLAGEDLGKRLARAGQLPLADAEAIVLQTAKALGRAHAAGVVHRDIKPENLFLLDADGDVFVKVLDFGVSKRLDDGQPAMTATGLAVGTPYYMSPEQLQSPRDVDHRCDLWALAVVAYFCVTGKRPFEGETLFTLGLAIDKATFGPVSDWLPVPSPSLDAWFARALARDPVARFGSARELAEAFSLACRAPLPTAPPEPTAPAAPLEPAAPPAPAAPLGPAAPPAPAAPLEPAAPPEPAAPLAPVPSAAQAIAASTAAASPRVEPPPRPRAPRIAAVAAAALVVTLAAVRWTRAPAAPTTSLPQGSASAPIAPPPPSAPPEPTAPAAASASTAIAPSDLGAGASAASAPPEPSAPTASTPRPPKGAPALSPPPTPLPLGARCAADGWCASAHCADGVCCDSACRDRCMACTAAKKHAGGGDGSCGFISGGEDPDRECGAGKRCNGLGGCTPMTREVIRRLTGHD